MSSIRTWVVGLAMLASGAAGAATLGVSATTSPIPSGQAPEGGSCGPVTLTQSAAQTITAGNSVSCSSGGIHIDNSYFRAYPSSALPTGFAVCGVNVGVEQALAGAGGQQPVTINLYANTGGAFPAGTRSLVGTASVQVADQNLTIANVPVAGSVPAGAELVVELFTPDGTAGGNTFFIGSNASGETGPSYLQAAGCGVTAPTPTSAIGFPGMNIVLDAIGTPAGSGTLSFAPAIVDFGNQVQGGTSPAMSVTLTNTGSGALNVTALTVAAAPFALSGGNCAAAPFNLAAAASCTLDYTFTPTALGAANQVLTITADVPGGGTFTLQGNGTAAPVLVPPATIPTLSSWGQLALLISLVVLVGFVLRRQQH